MNFKLISGLVIICLILVFIIQNIAIVEIRLFFWTIEISLVLLILILLGLGMVAGWLLNDYFTYRKKIKSQMKPQE
jgi:uncharacterized integral membrane protein